MNPRSPCGSGCVKGEEEDGTFMNGKSFLVLKGSKQLKCAPMHDQRSSRRAQEIGQGDTKRRLPFVLDSELRLNHTALMLRHKLRSLWIALEERHNRGRYLCATGRTFEDETKMVMKRSG